MSQQNIWLKDIFNSSGVENLQKDMQSKKLSAKDAVSQMLTEKKDTMDYINYQIEKGIPKDHKLRTDVKIEKWLEFLFEVNKQESLFKGYIQEACKDKGWVRADPSIQPNILEMQNRFISIRDNIILVIKNKVNSMAYAAQNMQYPMSLAVKQYEDNQNREYSAYNSESLALHVNTFDIINTSIDVMKKWTKKLNDAGYTAKSKGLTKGLKNPTARLDAAKTYLDNKGALSKLFAKGLMAEFIFRAELMQEAENNLQYMQDMVTVFEDNIAKYNANPQNFDANYNFEQDAKGYKIFPHWNSMFLGPNTIRDNAHFIDSFMRDMNSFFKLKDSKLFNEEEQSKVDQVVEMGNKLSAQLAKSNEVVTAFLSKVAELKSQIPTESTIKTNENIDSSTHSIELEKESNSAPSLESKPQLDNFSIMLDKIIAMKEMQGKLINELDFDLEYSRKKEFSTLLPSYDKLFTFNETYQTFLDNYDEYIESLSSEDDLVEYASEEEEQLENVFMDNLYSQSRLMKKTNEQYDKRLTSEAYSLITIGCENIDYINELKILTTKFKAQAYVKYDKKLIEKYDRIMNRLDVFSSKLEADAVNIDILRNSINNKAFDTVESSMTTNSQTEVMNLPVVTIEMNS